MKITFRRSVCIELFHAMNVRREWKIDAETTYVIEHLRWAFLKDVVIVSMWQMLKPMAGNEVEDTGPPATVFRAKNKED